MIKCDKCGCEIQEVDLGQGLELQGGKCLKFKDGEEEYYVTRCDKCFEKDTTLTNYKKTEVFTRCVGYMRPTSQFNKGKEQEYYDRKVFKQPMEEEPTPVEVETPVEETKTTPEEEVVIS
jgi:hypothetical protein